MKTRYLLTICATLALSTQANASEMVFHGSNPDITPTANPLNETAISTEAALTRPHNPAVSSTQPLSTADLLKQSVVAGLSSTYLALLTGNGSSSGTVDFGDGSYAVYSTSGTTRTITFYDVNGNQTTISFPLS